MFYVMFGLYEVGRRVFCQTPKYLTPVLFNMGLLLIFMGFIILVFPNFLVIEIVSVLCSLMSIFQCL